MGKHVFGTGKEYHTICYDARPSLSALDNQFFKSKMSDCNKRVKQSKTDMQELLKATEELEASPFWFSRWLGKMSRKHIVPFCERLVHTQIDEYRSMKGAVKNTCKLR